MPRISFDDSIRQLVLISHILSALLSVYIFWKAAESRNGPICLYPAMGLECNTPLEDSLGQSSLGMLRGLWMAQSTYDERAGALLHVNN